MRSRRRQQPVETVEVLDAPRVPGDGEVLGGGADPAGQSEWREWICAFGRRVRRAREAIGLSQQQLGSLAGVSQGAISRLEVGHGTATPLVIVLKIHHALMAELRALDEAGLDDEVRRRLEPDLLGPLADVMPLAADPVIEQLVRLYYDTPARSRERLLSVVRVAADGLRVEP